LRARNAVLLATLLEPSKPSDAERRLRLIDLAAAQLEKRNPGEPVTREEAELSAKIKTLRTTQRPVGQAVAIVK
jgi:hypothetical protein